MPMRIVLDPGHGGKDPGAVGMFGVEESHVNLAVALKIAENLRGAGVETRLTRTADSWLELQERCDIANSFGADYFVSIHCNSSLSPRAHGTETYCYKFGGKGEALAKAIQAELIAATGRSNRGVKEANFYVLRKTKMPSALVELAFVSNIDEERLLESHDYQEECALAVAKGIGKVIGVEITKPEPEQNLQEDDDMINKIVVYYGDIDALSAVVVAQKLQAPLMRRSDFEASGLSAKTIVNIGGDKGSNRFDTFKRAASLI